MNTVTYQTNLVPAPHFVLNLYEDAGWTLYTQNEEKLLSALYHSLCVITAWDGTKLVGLARAVGDGETILYIQDILVLKAYQRCGIGRQLMELLTGKYPDVRQKVLLTEETPETREFYEKIGFASSDKSSCTAFVKFES